MIYHIGLYKKLDLSITDFILTWLRDNPQFALLTVPCIAFLEATLGLGLFISGVVLLATCTLMYTEQIASLQQILPLAFLAALFADHCGFYLGRRLGPQIHHTAFGIRHQARFARTEKFIIRFGKSAVVVGRLMTAIRSLVPFMIGVSGMAPLRFSLLDVFACTVWVTGLGLLIVGLDKVLT